MRGRIALVLSLLVWCTMTWGSTARSRYSGLNRATPYAETAPGTLYTLDAVNDYAITIFALDPTTGASTPVIATDAYGAGGEATFDPVSRRLFFLSYSVLTGYYRIYTVNLNGGTFSHVSGHGYTMQFDQTIQRILTLGFHGPGVAVYLLDPATGKKTRMIQTDAAAINTDSTALDVSGRQFFFRAFSVLYKVNLATGQYTHFEAPGRTLEFDPASQTLYTLDVTGGHVTLFAVDVATGAMTPVVVTDATASLDGVSAFDPTSRRFFFRSPEHLYTVNVETRTFSRVVARGHILFFAESAAAAIPVASTGALALLVCALVCCALLVLSRV